MRIAGAAAKLAALSLASLCVASTPGLCAAVVVVGRGETLAMIAVRELGDEATASELAALNGLAATDTPAPGTKLFLPGPVRAKALVAIRGAQEAAAAATEERRAAATVRIGRAIAALHSARYGEAESLAGEARDEAGGPVTRVSVVVDPVARGSRFVVDEGSVEVTSGGTTAVASSGSMVRASSGTAPHVVAEARPDAPRLLAPGDGASVDGSDAIRWAPVAGALRFRLLIARDAGFRLRISSAELAETSAPIPAALGAGIYYWRVQALGVDGAEGTPSDARSFRVAGRTAPGVNIGKPIFGKSPHVAAGR